MHGGDVGRDRDGGGREGVDARGVVEVEPEGAGAFLAAPEAGRADGAVEVGEGAPGGSGSWELRERPDTALILSCLASFVS